MHAQLQMLENCKILISFNFCGNIQSVRCGHYAIGMYPFNITLFIFEYPHKMLPDPPLVTSPPLWTVDVTFFSILFCTVQWLHYTSTLNIVLRRTFN